MSFLDKPSVRKINNTNDSSDFENWKNFFEKYDKRFEAIDSDSCPAVSKYSSWPYSSPKEWIK